MNTQHARTASLDDRLGPSATRFFGSGYRRVGYTLTSSTWDAARARVEARVAVDYPRDWSTKSTAAALPPHLSTVDALVLAMRLGIRAVTLAAGLDPVVARTTWPRRVEIKAAAAPDEGRLGDVPVGVEVQGTEPLDQTYACSTVVGHVGALSVRAELVHARPDPAGRPLGGCGWDLAGPYGDGFRQQRQEVSDLVLDEAGVRASVALRSTAPDAPDPVAGLVDAFVVSLQLGQVLLYDLDGLDRSSSRTLWMRTTTLTADRPPAPADPGPATASLERPRLLATQGVTWRAATIAADGLGVRTRCAVAHQLPPQALATTASAAA